MTVSRPDAHRAITIVGHVCIDENTVERAGGSAGGSAGVAVDRAVVPGRMDDASTARRTPGSPAIYMHREYRRDPRLDVAIVAPYGSDFAEFAAVLPLVNGARGEHTLLYRNLLDGEHRRQECSNTGSAAAASIGLESAYRLQQTDLLLVSPLLPNFTPEYIAEITRLLPSTAVAVLLAQGYLREVGPDSRVSQRAFAEHAQILPLFDLVVFSDEDIADALPTAARWSTLYPATRIVVTQNRRGATRFEGGVATSFPAKPLGSVDPSRTIGAGDVFSAVLALAFRDTGDSAAAVVQANAAAAEFLVHAARTVSAA